MAKGVKIRDNKKKWEKLKRAVAKGSTSSGDKVQIGIFSEQGGDLVIYAATNEFGTKEAGPNHNIVIPERSWLRSTYDEQVKGLLKFIKKNKVKLVLGKVSRKSLLNKMGLQLVGAMQKKIAEGMFTPNAPSVKAKKISQGKEGKPLVAEGRLRQSITHRIV